MAELEFLCLNSRESYEDNKRFLRNRMELETNPAVRRLLEQDLVHLNRIQVQMATAPEFLVIIRLRNEKESEVFPYLSRIEKTLREQGFIAKRADKEDIKIWQCILSRMLPLKSSRTSMVRDGLS